MIGALQTGTFNFWKPHIALDFAERMADLTAEVGVSKKQEP